ncbi:protein kinase, putative [Bodo saltans]|uniref:non-specific serine/threonine protein kinase n=1 Tax=Bodo saltans TaxID=75058 RepID=A0A0S4JBY0_BODSA|nr:protein kinase, putative [Bodo saltans]|eukprot:CUG87906.1 protein kinase, putative [Bodo saltans]
MGSVVSVAVDACESLTAFVLPSGQHPSQVTIKQASYRIDVLIGEGGYSFVYKATDRVGRSTVALKRFAIQDADEQTRLLEEVSIHRGLCPHENIVALIEHDVISLKGKPLPEIWIAMEFAGPSMQTLVNARLAAGKGVERAIILQFLGDTIAALCHMHAQSPPISHWDVKLDNILQGDAYKLCDFGSASKTFYLCQNSQEVSIAEGELSQRMTLLYRAPETLDLWRKQRVDTKADIWSLGVAVYTSVMQAMPFEENPLDILNGVPKAFRDKGPASWAVGNPGNSLPADAQDIMALVMDHMLVADPSKRSDIFTVAEAFRQISQLFQVPARPRPGFVSAQKSRFAQ